MKSRPLDRSHAFALVAVAAALWGTDALFRRALALDLPSTVLVFYEHLILVVACLPLLMRLRWPLKLTGREWAQLLTIGVGASATATYLFTLAFRYGDPTTPLLLQKLQPFVAVVFAHLLLGERVRPRFVLFFTAAVVGAYLITFPDPGDVAVGQLVVALLAIGAASLWGLGTVLGRSLSDRLAPSDLTALRFAIGLPAAGVLVLLDRGPAGFGEVHIADAPALLALAAIPGLLALSLYYRGLAHTPASLATIAELSFPLTAIVVNRIAFGTSLSPSQYAGVGIVAGVLVIMGRRVREGGHRVGVVAPVPSYSATR